MAAKKSTDYQSSYNKLKTIAETMRQEEALDIDQLIPLVEEASKAYKACQERIAAVEKVLKTVE